MGNKADVRRRWLGAIFLTAALLMLVAGETVLAGRLSPFWFVLFWMVCLVFTCLAIAVALLDLSVTRRRTINEHRAMFAETLNEIARSSEARSRSGSSDKNK